MDEMTSRFLGAFNEVSDFLSRLGECSPHAPFPTLVTEGARRNSVVKRYVADLRELGELRNAIVHGYKNDEPLATPYPETVNTLESIRDHLLAPPRIIPAFQRKVYTCSPDSKFGLVVKTMLDQDFSQVPVYNEGQFVGLLNTATIARWLAARIERDRIVEEETVSSVLEHALPGKKHDFIGERATVFEALDRFERAFAAGNSLDAIIITAHGQNSEAPLGILTIYDIPKLQALAGLRR